MYYSVLESCKTPSGITFIMHKSNVNLQALVPLLKFCIDKGFIKKVRVSKTKIWYVLTEAGNCELSKYQHVRQLQQEL